jgi:hypothetical protein
MAQSRQVFFITLLILLFHSQAGTDETSPCSSRPWRQIANPAFPENEKLTYKVDWEFVKAGKAVLLVNGVEQIKGRPSYHISMDIRTSGLTSDLHRYTDHTDTWLDRDALVTLRYAQSVREKNYKDDEKVDFDQACGRFQRHENRLDKKLAEDGRGDIPPDTLDFYGALFFLRTQPLAVGQRYFLALYGGGKVIPVTAVVKKKEKLRTAAGKFVCFRIEPTTENRAAAKKIKQLRWWLSADSRHLPVRIRMQAAVGHISADLTGETTQRTSLSERKSIPAANGGAGQPQSQS